MHTRLTTICGAICGVAVVAVATLATAATDDVIGARATAMGGALRAAPSNLASMNSTSELFLNPAGMSLTRKYVLTGTYQFRSQDEASRINASIIDSSTSRIAAGLSYSFIRATPRLSLAGDDGPITLDETHTAHEIALALSTALGSWVTVGLTTRYINYHSEYSEDAPEDLETIDLSTVGLDIGAVVQPVAMIQLGVVGHNLIPVDDQLFPQGLGLGLAFVPAPTFAATFDSVVDFSSDPDGVTASFHGGLEALLGGQYVTRLGVLHDIYREATYVSGGLALLTPKLGVDISLRQQVDGGKSTIITAGLSLRAK